MKAKIEENLYRTFHQFTEAVEQRNAVPLEKLRQDLPERVRWQPQVHSVLPEISTQFASMHSFGGRGPIRPMFQATDLPSFCYHNVVISTDNPEDLDSMTYRLPRLGLPTPRGSRKDLLLRRLNMAVIRIPRHEAVLEALAQLPEALLLGDGDALVSTPRPAEIDLSPVFPRQAAEACMDFPKDFPLDGAGIRVAVIDTGIDGNHPGFRSDLLESVDIAESGMGPVDPDGHGTHVAGIIAGQPVGDWQGIAPGCGLLDLQVYHPMGTNNIEILAAIGYAMEAEVDLINLSMGVAVHSDGRSIVCRAIDLAASKGIPACVAVGNQGELGEPRIATPSDAPSAIAVAATDSKGDWAPFSSLGPSADTDYTGPKPLLAAPGVQVVSARSRYSLHPPHNTPDLCAMDGTSMATPMVSGIVALGLSYLRQKNIHDVSPSALKDCLVQSCRNIGNHPMEAVGFGVPQSRIFLRKLDQMIAPPPSPVVRKTQREATPVLSPNPIAALSETEPLKKNSLRPRFRQLAQAEDRFLEAVERSVRLQPELLAKTLGIKSRVTVEIVRDNNERRRIRDLAALGGIPESEQELLPLNSERMLELRKGKRAVAQVIVKSLAGWQALEQPESAHAHLTVEAVRKFLDKQSDEKGGLPTVYTLVAPEGWPASFSSMTWGDSKSSHVLLWQTNGEAGMYQAVGGDYVPEVWSAVCPYSPGERDRICMRFLNEHRKLRITDEYISLPDAAEELGLPGKILKQFVDRHSNQPDARFTITETSDGREFIQRIRMR